MLKCLFAVSLSLALASCIDTDSIPFDLTSGGPQSAPLGPKVASLIANLKCELFEASNNNEQMIRYYDDPGLAQHYDKNVPGELKNPDPDRNFTLHHLFEEIEFIGEAQLQLDVVGSAGISPTLNFIDPYKTAMTNLTGIVSGGLSEQAHRYVYLYTSTDFGRLVYSPPWNGKDVEGPLANFAPTVAYPLPNPSPVPTQPCGQGIELTGKLGFQEYFSAYFTVTDMNDIAVWPNLAPPGAKAPDKTKSSKPAGLTNVPTKIPDADVKFSVPQIQAQIDFQVTSGIGGGPNWTLVHFKGPSGMTNLLSTSRVSKNTLLVTYIPVCIRQKYHTDDKSAPYHYSPEPVEGSPRWAEFLPPCSRLAVQSKIDTIKDAHDLNLINSRGFIPLPQ